MNGLGSRSLPTNSLLELFHKVMTKGSTVDLVQLLTAYAPESSDPRSVESHLFRNFLIFRSLSNILSSNTSYTCPEAAMKSLIPSGCGAVALGLALLGPAQTADPPTTEKLLEMLKSPRTETRLQAMKALGNLGNAGKDAVPALRALLRHEDKAVADQAARSLAQIGPYALYELVKALEDPSAVVRVRAMKAIGTMGCQLGHAIAVPAVAKLLRSTNKSLRKQAATTLGEIGPEASCVADLLMPLLRDREAAVRQAAAAALTRIGPDAVPGILKGIDNDDLDVRLAAIQALSLISDSDEAVAALVQCLRDIDPRVRSEAAAALARTGAPARVAMPMLIQMLKENNFEVQKQAFAAIMTLASAEDPDIFVTLSKINERFRWANPQAFNEPGKLKEEYAILLKSKLGSAIPTDRLVAAISLGFLGRDAMRSVAALEIASKDSNAVVRAGAMLALPMIDPKQPQRLEQVKHLIADTLDDLKFGKNLDPGDLVRLHILLSLFSKEKEFLPYLRQVREILILLPLLVQHRMPPPVVPAPAPIQPVVNMPRPVNNNLPQFAFAQDHVGVTHEFVQGLISCGFCKHNSRFS
jgi:HEAT repeat protein